MHDSDHKIINCGVPQGSILGPLLFILYLNDIVNTTSLLELILFADDTTLLFSHPDIASQNEIINKELQEICNWFQANKLSVNAGKTNYRKYVIGFRPTSYLSMLVRQITWCSELFFFFFFRESTCLMKCSAPEDSRTVRCKCAMREHKISNKLKCRT